MAFGRLRRPLLILIGCFAAALGCGFVFVVILELSLPPNDAAYGRGLRIFLDPFVLFGWIDYSIISAFIAFPIAWYCLGGRKLLPCAVFATSIVLVEIVIVTPFKGWLGFI